MKAFVVEFPSVRLSGTARSDAEVTVAEEAEKLRYLTIKAMMSAVGSYIIQHIRLVDLDETGHPLEEDD